eukprot:TRINITY_DN3241_c0_g1_i3.p1 TRINITY_DN3241_c0_g1~~TRINITY_DN3241_c0_g1_i3.p1  ORF type:complete len:402 (+),score=141.28 TRINITY_DN3241_c0_g1_i3:136-1341(+)
MGETEIHLDEIEPEVVYDSWYILMPKLDDIMAAEGADKKKGNSRGEARLKLRYTEDMILPTFAYQGLLDFLIPHPGGPGSSSSSTSSTDPTQGVKFIIALDKVISSTERESLARALVATYHCPMYRAALSLLIPLTTSEIRATIHEETIFRGNSLSTKGVDAFMKLIALGYLDKVIGPTIKAVYAMKKGCEVDPTREKEENIAGNFARLVKLVEQLTADVFSSAPHVPAEIRVLFHAMQSQVVLQYGEKSTARYSVVSSFMFLRHICPALLNPKLFGLAPDHPTEHTARVFTLLSKTLQNLANLAEFGQKEPYMKDMNVFIKANLQNMMNFLDAVSVPVPLPAPELAPILTETDLRHVAAVHRHLDREKPSVLKLLSDPNLDPELKIAIEVGASVLEKVPH